MNYDKFRHDYNGMSAAEVAQFYMMMHASVPDQTHFNVDSARRFLTIGARVFELGGADGRLAGEILPRDDAIECWHNYELVPWVTTTFDARYSLIVPGGFVWESAHDLSRYDVAIFSHVLEHVNAEQADRIISVLVGVRHAYVDYPDRPPGGWTGTCAHVSELDNNGVKALMATHGYVVSNEEVVLGRSGKSTVMVFRR